MDATVHRRRHEEARPAHREASKRSISDTPVRRASLTDFTGPDLRGEIFAVEVQIGLTGQHLATIQLRPIAEIKELINAVQRQVNLVCKPRLYVGVDGDTLEDWETLADAGIDAYVPVFADIYPAVVTSSHDTTAKIWNAETGECEHTLRGHSDLLHAAAVAPDNRFVATASEDRTAKVWNVLSGSCERTLEHADAVFEARFSPDAKLLVTASADHTAKLWVVKTGICKVTFKGHGCPVFSAAFTPDGGQVLTAADDGTTKLWNLKTGICDRTLLAQPPLYVASFAPDGGSVVIAPGDTTAKIVNVQTDECELTLQGHFGLVTSATFAPAFPGYK